MIEKVIQFEDHHVEVYDDSGVHAGMREDLEELIRKGYVGQNTKDPEAPYTHLLVQKEKDRAYEVSIRTFFSYSK